jgi:type IV pilus assembly protein PilM
MPNELVEKYKAIFRAAGLHLVALEVESHPLIRAGMGGEKGTVLIMDIGAESTGYSIVEGGALKQVAQTDYGGAALTHALGRSLDISAWRAEELKKRRGLVGFGGETELSTSLEPFLDVIIQEGERVRGTYERTMGRKIQNVMLVGGGANLPGLTDFVKGRMQATILTPRPFAKVKYLPELEPAVRDLSNSLTLAAGLALKFYV